jgi:hypothetical protein
MSVRSELFVEDADSAGGGGEGFRDSVRAEQFKLIGL